MDMYYQEIQADGLQTLHLMNPNYVGYSADNQQTPQVLLNSANTQAVMPHAPLSQFVGLPLSHDVYRPSPVLGQQEDMHNTVPRFHSNIWGLVDHNQTNIMPPQGLSLSLSAHQTGFDNSNQYFLGQSSKSSPPITTTDDQSTNGASIISIQHVMMSSKYIKAAQELLDEVANVVGTDHRTGLLRDKAKIVVRHSNSCDDKDGGGGGEFTTTQIQEIQMKKAKLNSMLNEVDQRYRQYNHQMQIVVASFEQAAGIGSARTYTQLAFKTISKQFRCLKATISAQINALNKSLGGEDSLDNKLESTRLKFVDHQLRTNTWRPQRGLPERAVSILRSWLFEHFLHPYPKDSDKQMLAKKTRLTRSQVSNWFINARVRLWKPMVEEMYLEEQITCDRELVSNSTEQKKNSKTGVCRMNRLNALLQTDQQGKLDHHSPTEITAASTVTTSSAYLISMLNMDNLPENDCKKPRNVAHQDDSPSRIIISAEMEIKAGDQTSKNYLSMAAAANINRHGIGHELGRFSTDQQQLATAGFRGNNNFSLSLALPPTENSHQQINFLSAHRNFEFGTTTQAAAADSHPSIGYENNILDFQNRKPFPAQLLPDFVA